jgi:hypothetical protein
MKQCLPSMSEKICQQVVTVFGQYGFGVKLNPLRIEGLVADCHDFSACLRALGIDPEAI